jgi:hypothetical protein
MVTDNNNMQTITTAEATKELDDFIAKLNKKNGLVWMHGAGFHSTTKQMNNEER